MMRAGRPFISRASSQLLEGAQPYVIAGVNIGWLCLAPAGGWGNGDAAIIPSRFRVDDALQTAVALGCNFVRAHTLMPTLGHPHSLYPTAGTYNEEAALAQDYVLYRMGQLGLRTIVELCNDIAIYFGQCNDDATVNGSGGVFAIANWSEALGGDGADFFTNAAVIAGFKDIVSATVNRINRFNGLRWGDDPTIIGYETGNELQSPGSAWTAEIAAHLKSLAPRQLVADGATIGAFPTSSLSAEDVDLIGMHQFPMSASALAAEKATVESAGKAYWCGEYEPWSVTGGDAFATFRAALLSGQVNHAWYQLCGHDDGHGWPADLDSYDAPYQFPNNYDEGCGRNRPEIVASTRTLALTLRGSSAPWPVPGVPHLALSGSQLAWRGAAGAASYIVERSAVATSGFGTYAAGLTDADTPWGESLPSGYYRVRALNPDSLASQPSQPVHLS